VRRMGSILDLKNHKVSGSNIKKFGGEEFCVCLGYKSEDRGGVSESTENFPGL